MDNFKIISHSLDKLNDDIERIQNEPYIFKYPSKVSIVMMSILITLSIWIIYKCRNLIKPCFKCNKNNCFIRVINFYTSKTRNQTEQVVTYRNDEEEIQVEQYPAIQDEVQLNQANNPIVSGRVLRSNNRKMKYNLKN